MSKQISTGRNIAKGRKHERDSSCFSAEIGSTRSAAQSNQATLINARNLARINPKREFLTPEKLQSFEGCNHYNDQEALAVIESLDTLARIILGITPKPGTPIDNQQVLHLDINTNYTKKAA